MKRFEIMYSEAIAREYTAEVEADNIENAINKFYKLLNEDRVNSVPYSDENIDVEVIDVKVRQDPEPRICSKTVKIKSEGLKKGIGMGYHKNEGSYRIEQD